MQNMAWLIDRHGFHVMIDGHTRSQLKLPKPEYGAWELSADRANAARRLMESTGLREHQIAEVRGYADQRLRLPANPFDPSNRRISLIVQYPTVAPPKAAPTVAKMTSAALQETKGVSAPVAAAPKPASSASAPHSVPAGPSHPAPSPAAPAKLASAVQRLAARFHLR
jgi:chemotaxis protein MotB